MTQFQLSAEARANLAAEGAAGAAWAAALPALAARLERDWAIRIGAPYANATEAFAAEALTADGTGVAVKIPLAGRRKEREARMLSAAQGKGYVRLLAEDAQSGALLLERLGPQLAQLGLPARDQFAAICAGLKQAWLLAPQGLDLPTGADKARGMAAYIETMWAVLERPCAEHTMRVALRYAEARARAFDPKRSVAGHGDAHGWNTLQDVQGGFKFVDPDGWLIEPAHDVSIMMREWSAELYPDPLAKGRQRCALLARLSGAGEAAIWQWGLIERLVNGLLYLEKGPRKNAAEFIKVADIWAMTEKA